MRQKDNNSFFQNSISKNMIVAGKYSWNILTDSIGIQESTSQLL